MIFFSNVPALFSFFFWWKEVSTDLLYIPTFIMAVRYSGFLYFRHMMCIQASLYIRHQRHNSVYILFVIVLLGDDHFTRVPITISMDIGVFLLHRRGGFRALGVDISLPPRTELISARNARAFGSSPSGLTGAQYNRPPRVFPGARRGTKQSKRAQASDGLRYDI